MSVGIGLETMLLEPILEPMLGSLNAIGAYGTQALAREIAQADARRFSAVLAAQPA